MMIIIIFFNSSTLLSELHQTCRFVWDLRTSNSLQKNTFSLFTDLHLELFIYVSILN